MTSKWKMGIQFDNVPISVKRSEEEEEKYAGRYIGNVQVTEKECAYKKTLNDCILTRNRIYNLHNAHK